MKKWTDNKFLTLIGAFLALILNERLNLGVDIDKLMLALIVAGKYVAIQFALDQAKGMATRTFNSRKLVAMLLTCTLIIASEYIGFDLLELVMVTGVGGSWIGLEAYHDYKKIKGNGVKLNEPDYNQSASTGE